ncbi:TonB-dependent receptor plug domain-containing protein [Sphingobium sp. JS3065]|uniref:TonB-dependent receptor n=1 Tax=Sphingobium sp. JS3065 TaxID=2970925 RepID=UPI002264D6B3|nr:TonB-dependent receptor [Sphingobium sp. JS3065]UZW57514.1 TonB-dependent receptor plug domain-containing protein [Sphingobium sp. JS3065]
MAIYHRYIFGMVSSLAVMASFSFAAAQTESTPQAEGSARETEGLHDIVVTAQRREQRLQDVPVAVSTVDTEALAAGGIVSTDGLEQSVPAVSMTRQLSGATPYIRGVGTQSVSAGNEPAVAFYVDGVYYASPYANIFNFNNIEQVEVLRGPQGTLFGRNATGGLVHVRTRDPQAEPMMRASVSYGNYGTLQSSVYASAGTDKIAFDIAGSIVYQSDGYGKNLFTGADVNYRRERGIRSKIKFTPTDNLSIVLSGDYSLLQSDLGVILQSQPNTAVKALGGGRFDSIANLAQGVHTQYYGGSAAIELDLGGATLKSLTALRKLDTLIRFDQDATPIAYADIYLNETDRYFQQEVTLQGNLGDLVYTAGVFYFDGYGRYDPLGVRSISPTSNIDIYSPQTTRSLAGFVQGDYSFGNTTVTAGFRYTRDKRTNTPNLVVPGGDQNDPNDVIAAFPTKSATFSKPTWRLAVAQKFSQDVMVYASYNRGFKSGAYSASSPTAAPVSPETLDAYEVGLRSELFGRSLRFNLTGFYYTYKNIQLNRIVNGAGLLFNAAKGELYGAEVETAYFKRIGAGELNLSANLSFLHANYTSFPNGPILTPVPGGFNALTAGDLSGHRMIHAPKFSGSVAASYKVPVGDTTSLELGVNYFHSASFFWEPDNRVSQPSVDVVNASAGLSFADGKFKLRAFVKNLTKAEYYAYFTESTLGDKGGPADPRTYGVGFDVAF